MSQFSRFAIVVIISYLLLFLPSNGNAQVQRLSPDEGLSQSYVSNMLVDKKGYLWLATEGGLNKYDGLQVTSVNGPNDLLKDVQIDLIYQDLKGVIWIATYIQGLFSYDPDTGDFRQYLFQPASVEQLEQQTVYQILDAGDEQHLWLGRGTDLAILDRQSGKISKVLDIPDADKKTSVIRKMLQVNDFLFIATSDGLFVYDIKANRLRLVEHINSDSINQAQNNTKELVLLDENTLLVGAVQGLYQIDISQTKQLLETPDVPFKSQELISDLNIWRINKKANFLRLATDQGVFDYYKNENHLVKNTVVTDTYTLSDHNIIDMLEDEHGSLWLATKNDGAFYVPKNENYFVNYFAENIRGEGLSSHNVWTIAEQDEYLWLGTDNGLTKLNLSTYQSQVFLQDYFDDEFNNRLKITESHLFNDYLFFPSRKGLMKFNTRTYQVEPITSISKEYEPWLSNWLYGSYLHQNRYLYLIEPDNGPFIFDLVTTEITPLKGDVAKLDLINLQGFLAPLPDKPDQVLLSVVGNLYRVNQQFEQLEQIYQSDRFPSNFAIDLNGFAVDNDNVLWLSYIGMGLIGLDAETFQILYPFEADKNNIGTKLYALVPDKNGMIWISSHHGIIRFDPSKKHFQKFTVEDGLNTNEFNDAAYLTLADGRIAFGSVKGLTLFDPSMLIPKSAIINQLNITSISLMSRDIDLPSMSSLTAIELEHDDIGLEVSFSAMTFQQQERIEFQYQLGEQQEVSTRNNKVIFPKFSPGNYELKIRAKDPLTGVFTPEAKLFISVKYPPFRSPVYLTFYALLVLLTVFIWFHRRSKMQQKLVVAHKESQESEARLKLALEGSGSGVWDWNIESTTIYQPRLVNELGYSQDHVTLDEYLNKIHLEDRAKFRIEWLEFLSTNKGSFKCIYRVRHKSGYWRWYKDFGKVMVWDNQMPSKVAGTYTNMTNEFESEENARLFGAAFEYTRDWVFILDKQFRVRATNQVLRESFNFNASHTSSRKLSLGLNKDTRLNYLRIIAKLKAGEHFQSDEVVVTADGIAHPVIIKVSTVGDKDNNINNYIVVITDISEQKDAEKELRVLANYDTLTKLPNRSLLLDRISHATELSRRHKNRLALLFIDLDHFKQVNDTLGHDFGDTLLITVAQRLKYGLRKQDTVARLGGDEFVILIEDIDTIDELIPVCRKICEEVSLPVQLGNHRMTVEPSIGVAIFPDDADNSLDLLKSADIAMYHAKKRGGATYQFFHQEMNHKIQRKVQLENELKEAVKLNQFVNYYQPIISATDFTLKGFEVLLRWRQDNKLISPAEFIPVAESMGLITTLTFAALTRAMQDLKAWLVSKPDCYVSVNLSARDFEHETIGEKLTDIILQADISPTQVVFEITESALMQDSQKALEAMLILKQKGCRIYMDDFGTGYSSLSYLKRFPIDVLKIDQSFVADIGQDASDEAIIHSTLALAHSLGKSCVAEGVETKAQVEFLQMLGCDYLQGYLFSKPVPSNEVSNLLDCNWLSYYQD